MKLQNGFSIIEMAVVLVIVGLLIGGMLLPLSTQMTTQKIVTTQQTLDEVKDALLGFAIVNKRLPCPTSNDDAGKDSGLETTTPCNVEGYLPWATLGVGRYDAWGNTFRYRADSAFTTSIPSNLTASSGLVVKDRTPISLTNTDTVVAIIFSYGKDGQPNGDNTNLDAIYTQDSFIENTFDDILVWLPKNILINRLVAAGRFP